MTNAALELRGLSISFGGVRALDKVSLEVHEGEILGLIGPNGAGKTTLINLISGHEKLQAGSVRLAGREIGRMPVHERARLGLARSFQRTNIFPEMTVWENIWLCAAAARVGHYRIWVTAGQRQQITETCNSVLAATDLMDALDTEAANLSHGQARSLEVALLLAAEGRVLLLDEPAAGMPLDGIRQVIMTLSHIHERTKSTMVIVEHKLPVVFGLCDRIAVLEQGRLIALDTPDNIVNDPRVKEAYLGESLEV